MVCGEARCCYFAVDGLSAGVIEAGTEFALHLVAAIGCHRFRIPDTRTVSGICNEHRTMKRPRGDLRLAG